MADNWERNSKPKKGTRGSAGAVFEMTCQDVDCTDCRPQEDNFYDNSEEKEENVYDNSDEEGNVLYDNYKEKEDYYD